MFFQHVVGDVALLEDGDSAIWIVVVKLPDDQVEDDGKQLVLQSETVTVDSETHRCFEFPDQPHSFLLGAHLAEDLREGRCPEYLTLCELTWSYRMSESEVRQQGPGLITHNLVTNGITHGKEVCTLGQSLHIFKSIAIGVTHTVKVIIVDQ